MSEPITRIEGAGGSAKSGGGNAGGKAQDQQVGIANIKDTIKSKSYALVVEALSEGPIVGLVNGSKGIMFDDTQLQADNGNYNFEGVTWQFQPGDPDQDWLPGFPNASSEVGVGLQVFKSVGRVIRTTTNDQLDTIIFRIRTPKLIKFNNKGEAKDNTLDYTLGYKKSSDGNYTTQSFSINGITTSPFEKQHKFNVRSPGDTYEGPWDLFVQRDTADHDDSEQEADQLFWQSYTEIEEVKLIYPDTAVIGFKLPAKTFNGGIPVRSYDIKGRIVRKPVNYNATTRIYTGLWNGSFDTAWTDNPVWCLLDLLTNTRYGLGLADNQIDLAALYTISQYCDELVNDGIGGTHPRYTLNIRLDAQKDAYELINEICAHFITMPYYSSGAITFSQDSPRDPDILVTRANSVDGVFKYQDQSFREKPNTILVSWVNPILGGKGDVEAVEDQTEIIRRGKIIDNPVDLAGINDRGRAQRLGRWNLYSGLFDGEVVTYRAGMDHADCVPGWIVSIRDPIRDGTQYGGRVIDSYGQTVVLDRPLTVASGGQLMILRPDKTVGEFTVTSPIGSPSDTFIIASPPDGARADLPGVGAHAVGVGAVGRWDDAGGIGSIWGYLHTTNVPEVLWRVISKLPVENNTQFEVTAIRHHPDKYALIESGQQIDSDLYGSSLTGAITEPTALSANEYLAETIGGVTRSDVWFGWTDSTDPRVTSFRVEYKSNTAGIWILVDTTESLSIVLNDLPLDTYDLRVRGETPFGRASPWVVLEGVQVDGIADAPPDVQNLTLSVTGISGTLKWDAVTSLMQSHYEIRFTTDISTPAWETSAILAGDITSAHFPVSVAGGTYFVKAVSLGGTYSANAASVLCIIPILSPPNVLVEVSEEPNWFGGKSNVSVVSNNLKLVHDPALSEMSAVGAMVPGKGAVGRQEVGDFGYKSSGYYLSYTTLYTDLGDTSVCRVTPKLTYFGENQANVMGTWVTLATVSTLGGVVPGDYQVYVEFRFTDDAPLGIAASEAGNNVGNMSGGGGIDKAFDGSTNQPNGAQVSSVAGTMGWIGRDLNTPSKIHRVRVYGSNDQGFVGSANIAMTIQLYGKVGGVPSNDLDGVKLGETTFTDTADEHAGRDVFSIDDATTYDNFWVRIVANDGSSNTFIVVELELFSPPTWTAWELGVVGDYAFRGMQMRTQFISNDINVTPVLSEQHLQIDMPDRTVGDNNVAVSSGGVGLDVTFNPSFIFLKGVAIAIRAGAQGDYYTLSGPGGSGVENEIGFSVKLFNSAGVQKSGNINYVAYGYGRRTV